MPLRVRLVVRVGHLRRTAVVNRASGSSGRLGPAGFHPPTCALRLHTHQCPVAEAGREQHYDHLSAAYFNSWHVLLPLADVWIFGHTHQAIDTQLDGCRIISNPLVIQGKRQVLFPI